MENKYFVTYSHYYDCPTCDGNGSHDVETIYLSKPLENLKQIIDFLQKDFHSNMPLCIYSMVPGGKLKLRCVINIQTAMHNIHIISFHLEKHKYSIDRYGVITSTNPTFNVIYGK